MWLCYSSISAHGDSDISSNCTGKITRNTSTGEGGSGKVLSGLVIHFSSTYQMIKTIKKLSEIVGTIMNLSFFYAWTLWLRKPLTQSTVMVKLHQFSACGRPGSYR